MSPSGAMAVAALRARDRERDAVAGPSLESGVALVRHWCPSGTPQPIRDVCGPGTILECGVFSGAKVTRVIDSDGQNAKSPAERGFS